VFAISTSLEVGEPVALRKRWGAADHKLKRKMKNRLIPLADDRLAAGSSTIISIID